MPENCISSNIYFSSEKDMFTCINIEDIPIDLIRIFKPLKPKPLIAYCHSKSLLWN